MYKQQSQGTVKTPKGPALFTFFFAIARNFKENVFVYVAGTAAIVAPDRKSVV